MSIPATDERQRGFVQGQVYAAAELIRTFDQPTMAGHLISDIAKEDFSLCADYDLAVLRKHKLIPKTIKGR